MMIMNYNKQIARRTEKRAADAYGVPHQKRTAGTARGREDAAFPHTSNLPHLSDILFSINRFL